MSLLLGVGFGTLDLWGRVFGCNLLVGRGRVELLDPIRSYTESDSSARSYTITKYDPDLASPLLAVLQGGPDNPGHRRPTA